jgi:hypothetical protein
MRSSEYIFFGYGLWATVSYCDRYERSATFDKIFRILLLQTVKTGANTIVTMCIISSILHPAATDDSYREKPISQESEHAIGRE